MEGSEKVWEVDLSITGIAAEGPRWGRGVHCIKYCTCIEQETVPFPQQLAKVDHKGYILPIWKTNAKRN